jgi:hypothetical protein
MIFERELVVLFFLGSSFVRFDSAAVSRFNFVSFEHLAEFFRYGDIGAILIGTQHSDTIFTLFQRERLIQLSLLKIQLDVCTGSKGATNR